MSGSLSLSLPPTGPISDPGNGFIYSNKVIKYIIRSRHASYAIAGGRNMPLYIEHQEDPRVGWGVAEWLGVSRHGYVNNGTLLSFH